MIKVLNQEGIEELLTKCKKIQSNWKTDIIFFIYKNGDKRRCRNHRGFTLLSILEKKNKKKQRKQLRICNTDVNPEDTVKV